MEAIENLIYNHDLPNAFFCANDLVAMGVIRKLKDNGIRVPEDVAVVGFTEMALADWVSPPLSSVKQPTFEMGKKAAQLLIKQMEQDSFKVETIVLNGELNIRESSMNKILTID